MLNEIRNRSTGRWLAAAGLAGVTMAAQAADPAASENGLMTFPNVRVVSAPVPAAKAAAAPQAQGAMRAYIDPATGQLTQPTAEQAAALDAQASAPTARQSRVQSEAVTTTIYPAQGGVGMMLDESQMTYYVARRSADGTLMTVCLPDAKAARSALKASGSRKLKTVAKGETK
jgi:hypothetical protein